MKGIAVCALFFAAVCLPCRAQTIYESKDKAGNPVFTDQKAPGGKAVDLPPPNVVQTPALPKSSPAPAAAPAPYSSLAIASLENEGTIHTNTGEFDIRARAVPALRSAAGDRIRVKLDGNLLPTTYASRWVKISAEDWQAAATQDAQHTIQIAIVDGSGTTLIESAPVTFYAHRATVRRRAR